MPGLWRHDDDSGNGGYDGEEFDIRKFHSDAEGLDDVDNNYHDIDDDYDSNDEKLYARKFHDNAAGLDVCDHEELDGMRFHGVSKNYERVRNYGHDTNRQMQGGCR